MPKNFQSPSVCLETPRMSSPFVVMFILWMLIGEKSSKNSKIPWLLDWMLPNASLQTTICMPTSKLLFVKITKLWCKKTCSTDSNYDGYFLSCDLGIEFGAWFWQLILSFFQQNRNLIANSETEFGFLQFVQTSLVVCVFVKNNRTGWKSRENLEFIVFEIGFWIISGEQDNCQSLSAHSWIWLIYKVLIDVSDLIPKLK